MRCPECHTHNEDEAHACGTCGLIFIAKPATPERTRRAEDLARNRRRQTDRSLILCRFCGGEIYSDAARCRHCSEIIKDDYYRERAQKLRARVNYSSGSGGKGCRIHRCRASGTSSWTSRVTRYGALGDRRSSGRKNTRCWSRY